MQVWFSEKLEDVPIAPSEHSQLLSTIDEPS